jgi:thiol-disulfide isomerase/thioredoxin
MEEYLGIMETDLKSADQLAGQPSPPQPDSMPPESWGPRNLIIVAVVALTVAGMIFFAVHHTRLANTLRANGSGPASVNDLFGKQAPAFELKTLDGGPTVRLADYRGKAVMLDFWATWCGPCRVEMPWFRELQERFGPQGFVILAIAMDDDLPAIRKFAKDVGANYPILLGQDSVADSFGVQQGFPTNVFIDRDGKVINGVVGVRGQSDLEANIKRALGSVSAEAPLPAGSQSR